MQITFSYALGTKSSRGRSWPSAAIFIRVVFASKHRQGFNIYLRDWGWVTETGKTVRVEAMRSGMGPAFPSVKSLPNWAIRREGKPLQLQARPGGSAVHLPSPTAHRVAWDAFSHGFPVLSPLEWYPP
jgi:hypothetical protein